jgi:uncharacterized protein (DUF488 family)
MTIYTIGYEGSNIEEFVDFLSANKITCVVDVRKNPVSRKKGFSKRRMSENLLTRNIRYTHLPDLGVPTDWRKKAKAHLITRQKMFRDYVRKILPLRDEALTEIVALARKERLALLCYECDAQDCHRHYITEELASRGTKGLRVVNLQLPEPRSKSIRLNLREPSIFR